MHRHRLMCLRISTISIFTVVHVQVARAAAPPKADTMAKCALIHPWAVDLRHGVLLLQIYHNTPACYFTYRTVTIEYQRAQAKDLVAYFKSKAEAEAIQKSQYVSIAKCLKTCFAIMIDRNCAQTTAASCCYAWQEFLSCCERTTKILPNA
eukprot:jgi/Ulvmu1/3218/UM015_0259.1